MPTSDFSGFFSTAYGSARQPYDYQVRLADLPCESRLITVPTGLGKTAAVVLAWLFNRVAKNDAKWPRRLIYCLPMRTLVEQTAGEAQKWINALVKAGLKGMPKTGISIPKITPFSSAPRTCFSPVP